MAKARSTCSTLPGLLSHHPSTLLQLLPRTTLTLPVETTGPDVDEFGVPTATIHHHLKYPEPQLVDEIARLLGQVDMLPLYVVLTWIAIGGVQLTSTMHEKKDYFNLKSCTHFSNLTF